MSGTTVRPAAGGPRSGAAGAPPRRRSVPLTPAGAVIAAATLLALGLRAHQLALPGILMGADWYDDGVYFASALRLVHGVLPYRDFIFAQPPGITLLMTPSALLAKWIGTAGGMAAGKILTGLASTACVVLGGLLVRHRGLLAVIVTCGLIAVFPADVATSHTIFLEPWLALFCLAGAVTVFDGDVLAHGKRLVWGGVMFGFGGAVESWAIIPVLVILGLSLPRPRRAARFAAGVAAGFLIPVLPFAALDPRRFYESVFVAQLARVGAPWVSDWFRIQQMAGLALLHNPSHATLLAAALVLVGFVAGTLVCASLITRRPPPALESFAILTAALVVAAFMWPPDFFYHFPAFLAPFLALAMALPASRLVTAAQPLPHRFRDGPWLRWLATGLAGLAIVVLAVVQARSEVHLAPRMRLADIAAARRVIPPGACVFTDQVSFTIAADRFISDVPGCQQMIDPLGTSLALSSGRDGLTGAGRIPVVAAIFRTVFAHAQYVWLADSYNLRRIAWTPWLRAYFHDNFVRVLRDRRGDALYARKGLHRG